MPSASRQPKSLLPALAISQVALLSLFFVCPPFRFNPYAFYALHFAHFATYFLACRQIVKEGPTRHSAFLSIWMAAIASRFLAMQLEPEFSDDYFRYLWEGWVVGNGANPYAFSPGSPWLDGLDHAMRERVNYPDLPTVYPPLAMMLFSICSRFADPLWAWKIVLFAAELGTALLLQRRLQVAGVDRGMILIYLWNPLILLEVHRNAHVDGAAILFLVMAACLLSRQRFWPSFAAVIAAILTKLTALVAIPYYGWKRRRHVLPLALLLFAAIAFAYLPFLPDRQGSLWISVVEYGKRWRFNDFFFSGLMALCDDLEVAKAIIALFVTAAWVWGLRVCRSLESYLGWVLSAIFFFAPVFHPWYFLWVLPWLPFLANRGLILLSGLLPLAYVILIVNSGNSDLWVEPWWPKVVIFLPSWSLAIYDGLAELRRRAET